jgi:hypothetical protein
MSCQLKKVEFEDICMIRVWPGNIHDNYKNGRKILINPWCGGLMVRRCFPVAEIVGSSPIRIVFDSYNYKCME